MKQLPIKLRKNGFLYTQVLRCGPYYIYEQNYSSGLDQDNGEGKRLRFYEVIKPRIRPAESIKGQDYPEREVFPSDEDFGYTAWAYTSFEQAINKLMIMKGHKK